MIDGRGPGDNRQNDGRGDADAPGPPRLEECGRTPTGINNASKRVAKQVDAGIARDGVDERGLDPDEQEIGGEDAGRLAAIARLAASASGHASATTASSGASSGQPTRTWDPMATTRRVERLDAEQQREQLVGQRRDATRNRRRIPLHAVSQLGQVVLGTVRCTACRRCPVPSGRPQA